MIYEILQYGNPLLREKAKSVEKIDDEIIEIFKSMAETMYDSKGIGLAATQVGIMKRLFVCDQGDGNLKKIINPVITTIGTEMYEHEEGCLSIPGIYKNVKRPKKIKIEYLNEKGETVVEEHDDMIAVIMQHELDHLDGILFIDKVSPMAKKMISKKLLLLKKEYEQKNK